MKGKKQRSFSSEFKIEVVKEYLETDRSYRELGRKYDLSSSAICNWVKEYREYKERAFKATPGRKSSFISDESKIPVFLKEELGLDKLKEKAEDLDEAQAEIERLRLELAERELRIKLLEEMSKKNKQERRVQLT